jgi:SSS family solute:Na+ symporter
MGLGIVVAVKANKLIDISVFMLGLSSAELTANWGQWWWWRFNGPARLAASFGGPVIFLVMRYVVYPTFILPYYLRPENMPHWLAATADRLPAEVVAGKICNSYIYIPILASIGLTCLLWIVVALVTKPDPEEKLIEFYRRARPMGWWGPIARRVQDTQPSSRPVFTGLAIAMLGAVAVASGTIGFSCAYIARWWVATIAAALALAAGAWFARAYGRYTDRLLADEPRIETKHFED